MRIWYGSRNVSFSRGLWILTKWGSVGLLDRRDRLIPIRHLKVRIHPPQPGIAAFGRASQET
jgi:hypothetical protein